MNNDKLREEIAKWVKSRLIRDRNEMLKLNSITPFIPDSPFETLKPEAQEAWKQDADQILALLQVALDEKDGEIARKKAVFDTALSYIPNAKDRNELIRLWQGGPQ